ncbi:MAG: CHAT domain-containing tetratricopeptide repeat protein [Bacteroidales bacterium]
MKTLKTLLVFLITILCFHFSFGQDITNDTIIANEYITKADRFNLNRKRDSSVVYYDKASALLLSYYKRNKDTLAIKKYIHCQSNNAYDLAHLGKVNEAYEIVDTLFGLCEKFQVANELLARVYLAKGYCYDHWEDFPEAINLYVKSLELYELEGDTNNIYVCRLYSNIAIVFYSYGMFSDAIIYAEHALKKVIELFGEETTNAAALYNIAGVIYEAIGELDIAMQYKHTALQIFKKVEGDQSIDVADVLLNLGGLYQRMFQYDEALNYYDDALSIYLEFDDVINIANVYNNIAVVYENKKEFNLALEYYFYARDLYLSLLGESHTKVATIYNNLGVVYDLKGDYLRANDYYQKALTIRRKLLGEEHPDVAIILGNLGVLQIMLKKYDLAIEYLNTSLKIKKKVYGKDHIEITKDLFNLGMTYKQKGEFDKAISYYENALKIRKRYYGNKHIDIAWIYSNLGSIYFETGNFEQSLLNFQKAVIALVPEFNDSNISEIPALKIVEDKKALFTLLLNKLQVFIDYDDMKYADDLRRHFYICDTLIKDIRQQIQVKSDKIELGKRSYDLYYFATYYSALFAEQADDFLEKSKYLNETFLFLEKNKAAVLLEALASSEAKEFAHIPDSLLSFESNLKSEIAFYQKELLTTYDSSKIFTLRENLFRTNRRLDSLNQILEKNYPNYYELKYSSQLVSLKTFQELLDDKTAMISYLTTDSLVLILNISKDTMSIDYENFYDLLHSKVKYYRSGLIYTSSSRLAELYKKQAYEFYQTLIPQNIDPQIENLVIIPDAELSMIPFETFLTEEAGDKDWNELPYLIKKYNISYSYSANLFYKTFPKTPTKEIETTNLNDWMAFAPVFDDSQTAGVTLRTRELLQEFDSEIDDTLGTRGRLIDGGYISPLPGTESEVQSIFSEFDEKGKKAVVQFKQNANEEFVKSGGLKNYKYLHFATHGFVNTEKPELSGIFLAQDSTLNEDGILYQGEIYNLDLNADLTVLSACETGLGQIKKGEGLIGLTRALLYAGSKNIIVSLWKVADNSTSDLMVDFYKNLLEEELEKQAFSHALQQAKLKMINEEKYAHPFYWSPFILIGK